MLVRLSIKLRQVLFVVLACAAVLFSATNVLAQPFGQGVYGAHVPFGSLTSLSINLGGNVAIALTPSGSNFTGTGSHTVTVTSTDVVGYYLYAHTTGSTNMVNGAATIPVSSNTTAGPLSVGTWGYNTDGSSNFLGMNSTGVLLKDASGPFESGDATTVTYGALVNNTQAAGTYTTAVTYTVVAKNQ